MIRYVKFKFISPVTSHVQILAMEQTISQLQAALSDAESRLKRHDAALQKLRDHFESSMYVLAKVKDDTDVNRQCVVDVKQTIAFAGLNVINKIRMFDISVLNDDCDFRDQSWTSAALARASRHHVALLASLCTPVHACYCKSQ